MPHPFAVFAKGWAAQILPEAKFEKGKVDYWPLRGKRLRVSDSGVPPFREVRERMGHPAQGNISQVVEEDATSCNGNVEVKFYRLIGGVHQWYLTPMNVAGQVPYNPDLDSTTGLTTNDILWNFLRRTSQAVGHSRGLLRR